MGDLVKNLGYFTKKELREVEFDTSNNRVTVNYNYFSSLGSDSTKINKYQQNTK